MLERPSFIPEQEPDWTEYEIKSLQKFKNPGIADATLALKLNLYENAEYKYWKEKPYIKSKKEHQEVEVNFIIQVLLVREYLPWVWYTMPFTNEMAATQPSKLFPGDFIHDTEDSVNALRVAYQNATLKIPDFTGFIINQNFIGKGVNQDFVDLWNMTGPERVEWIIEILKKRAQSFARRIQQLADNFGMDGQREASEFLRMIKTLLK